MEQMVWGAINGVATQSTALAKLARDRWLHSSQRRTVFATQFFRPAHDGMDWLYIVKMILTV